MSDKKSPKTANEERVQKVQKEIQDYKEKKTKKSKVPEQVVNLKQELEDTIAQAEIAEELETDLAAANEKIKQLQNDLAQAKTTITRLQKTQAFTADDELRLGLCNARLEFDQDFKTGKRFITFRGAHPARRVPPQRLPDMAAVIRRVREVVKL